MMAVNVLTYADLLNRFPTCPGATQLPASGGENSPNYVRDAITEFVPPNLFFREDVQQPPAPKVVVVSAAGAVGKSTLAKAISFNKGAPLWDLAKYQTVGKSSLIGELTTAFTPGKLPQVLADLMAGNLFFVIDALDEARLKVTESAFLDL